jgi:hypothetical protein
MAFHTVRPGECLASIAEHYGCPDWRPIWEHKKNAQLRERRGSPHVLLRGDKLFVPDRRTKEVSASIEARHRFRVRRNTVHLRLELRNRWGDPYADRDYTLELVGQPGPPIEGTTDGAGVLDEEIPVAVEEALLTLCIAENGDEAGRTHRWRLRVGRLDPPDTRTGVRARLRNLGYAVEGGSNQEDRALRLYQAAHELAADGIAGPVTQAKLVEDHRGT